MYDDAILRIARQQQNETRRKSVKNVKSSKSGAVSPVRSSSSYYSGPVNRGPTPSYYSRSSNGPAGGPVPRSSSSVGTKLSKLFKIGKTVSRTPAGPAGGPIPTIGTNAVYDDAILRQARQQTAPVPRVTQAPIDGGSLFAGELSDKLGEIFGAIGATGDGGAEVTPAIWGAPEPAGISPMMIAAAALAAGGLYYVATK